VIQANVQNIDEDDDDDEFGQQQQQQQQQAESKQTPRRHTSRTIYKTVRLRALTINRLIQLD